MGRTCDLSPDGKWLVFTTWGNPDRFGKLYLLHLCSHAVFPLVTTGKPAGTPTFTPDGTQVIYRRSEWPDPQGSQLWQVDIDGRNNSQLTQETRHFHLSPSVAPNGTRIVFQRSRWVGRHMTLGDIFSIRTDGTDMTQHTEGSHQCVMSPHVGPDSDTVAFWANPWDAPHARRGIATISLTSFREPHYVYTNGYQVSNPRFGPEGVGFCFIGDVEKFCYDLNYAPTLGQPSQPLGIFKRRLSWLRHSGTSPRNPLFTPEGEHLYFLNDTSLWRIRVDGTELVRIADRTLFTTPLRWRPQQKW